MKTFNEIKDLLLSGEEVVLNKWAAKISDNDEVEIYDPRGEGYACKIAYLDTAVNDFIKMANGMPDKTPKPITYPATKDPKSILGPDSTTDKPWKDPKVNQTPETQGKKPKKDLGSDTTSNSPWTDPAVNKRPQEPKGRGGLPATELGSDTTKNPTKWGEKSTLPSESNEDHYALEGDQNAHQIKNKGETPSSPEAFRSKTSAESVWRDIDMGDYGLVTFVVDKTGKFYKVKEVEFEDGMKVAVKTNAYPDKTLAFEEAVVNADYMPETTMQVAGSIVDSFEGKEDRGPSYRELVAASPSANLLRDIADPYKWNMNRVLDKLAAPFMPTGEMEEDDEEEDVEAGCHGKGANVRTAGPKIREGWGSDGGYKRDLEAESAEELYHLTRSFSSEDDYPWEKYKKPVNAEQPIAPDPANPAQPMDQQNPPMTAGRNAQHVRKEPGYDPSMDPFAADPTQDEWLQGDLYEGAGSMELLDKEIQPYSKGDELIDSAMGAPVRGKGAPGYDPNTDPWAKFEISFPGFEGQEFDSEEEARKALTDAVGDVGGIPEDAISRIARKLIAKKSIGAYSLNIEDYKTEEFPTYQAAYRFLKSSLEPWEILNSLASLAIHKVSVDEKAKSYWSDYLKDYGKEMSKDDRGNKSRKDEKKSEGFEPKVDETPESESKGSDPKGFKANKKSQALPPGAQVSPEDTKAPALPKALPPPAAPGAAPGAAPVTPKPDAGNEGLKALGWTDQDIQVMGPEDKQKILQVQLKKPGSTPGQAQAPKPGQPPMPTPKPLPTNQPAPGDKGPVPGVAPAPAAPSPIAASFREAMNMIAQAVPVPEAAPAPAPAAPASPSADPSAAKPAVPGTPQPGGDFAPGTEDTSPESAAMNIYNQVLEMEVKASTPNEVIAKKVQTFLSKLLTEAGMTANEARQFFGISRDRGFNTLFES